MTFDRLYLSLANPFSNQKNDNAFMNRKQYLSSSDDNHVLMLLSYKLCLSIRFHWEMLKDSLISSTAN